MKIQGQDMRALHSPHRRRANSELGPGTGVVRAAWALDLHFLKTLSLFSSSEVESAGCEVGGLDEPPQVWTHRP